MILCGDFDDFAVGELLLGTTDDGTEVGILLFVGRTVGNLANGIDLDGRYDGDGNLIFVDGMTVGFPVSVGLVVGGPAGVGFVGFCFDGLILCGDLDELAILELLLGATDGDAALLLGVGLIVGGCSNIGFVDFCIDGFILCGDLEDLFEGDIVLGATDDGNGVGLLLLLGRTVGDACRITEGAILGPKEGFRDGEGDVGLIVGA